MKNMLDIVLWVVGLAAAGFAIYEYYYFATHKDGGTSYLYMAIAGTVVAFICALIFFVRRVNKEEEIHITQ